jgi:hypothetical protein
MLASDSSSFGGTLPAVAQRRLRHFQIDSGMLAIHSGVMLATDSGVTEKVANFAPEQVANFSPEWVANMTPESMANLPRNTQLRSPDA